MNTIDVDDDLYPDSTNPEDWAWVEHWSDLLDQDRVWRNAEGQILRLDDMDPDYCARVRSFALRQAEAVHTRLLWEMANPGFLAPSGNVAVDCFNREWDILEQEGENPKAWLAKFPLLMALKYRSEGLPARPTTCHCGYPNDEDWDHSHCYPGITVD